MIATIAVPLVVSAYLTAVTLGLMFASTPDPSRQTCADILATLPGWQPDWQPQQPTTGMWRPDPDLAAARRDLARRDVRELLGVA